MHGTIYAYVHMDMWNAFNPLHNFLSAYSLHFAFEFNDAYFAM